MQVTSGAVVSFKYTLTDDDGVIIDTNADHPALVYLHGHGNIIPGLEDGLEGSATGDKCTVNEVDPDRLFELGKDEFPEELPLEEGMQFVAETAGGEMAITISEVRENTVICDANHPLAGMTLHFDIEIVDVREATEEELQAGQPLS
jgi:FKBP-type peptidyl-prolyl cis-trans isomerase SlyD